MLNDSKTVSEMIDLLNKMRGRKRDKEKSSTTESKTLFDIDWKWGKGNVKRIIN